MSDRSDDENDVGIITAPPITTLADLESAYQQALRGRHISEIAPVLALRNKALEAFASATRAQEPAAWMVFQRDKSEYDYRLFGEERDAHDNAADNDVEAIPLYRAADRTAKP